MKIIIGIENNKQILAKDLDIEDADDLEFEIYNKKMDEGYLTVMMVDYIICLLCVSDEFIKDHFAKFVMIDKNGKQNSGVDGGVSAEVETSFYSQIVDNTKFLLTEQENNESKAKIESVVKSFSDLMLN